MLSRNHPSVFNHKKTYEETLLKVVDLLNETTEQVNTLTDAMTYLQEQGISDEVLANFNSKISDGTLGNLINGTLLGSINTKVTTNTTNIGTLSNLQTTDKSSLVNAINNNVASMADIAQNNKVHETKITSHRGVANAYPENTLLSIEMACKAGYKVVSIDIVPTSDNVLVLHHDTTVDRMTNGTGSVTSFTLAAIKALKIDGGVGAAEYPNLTIPTLEESLVIFRKYNVRPMIELKLINDFSQVDNLIALLKKYGFEYNSSIEIPVMYLIDEFRKRGGKSEVLFLSPITTSDTAALQAYGNCGYDSDKAVVTQSVIEDLHSKGLKIAVYTVNDTNTAKDLVSWGADYIHSDTIRGVL